MWSMETITRSTSPTVPTAVSDLFFNYSHDSYDQLYAQGFSTEDAQDEEIHASLKPSAEEFIGCLNSIVDTGLTADDLIADFLKRV